MRSVSSVPSAAREDTRADLDDDEFGDGREFLTDKVLHWLVFRSFPVFFGFLVGPGVQS